MDNAQQILSTSWKPTRDEFLHSLGLNAEGLGAQLFENVFDSFFVSSIDLKREYEKYYSVEYATFNDFLETRYGESVSDDELERERILLVTFFPQIIDPNYEDNMLDTVLKCIEREEEYHED